MIVRQKKTKKTQKNMIIDPPPRPKETTSKNKFEKLKAKILLKETSDRLRLGRSLFIPKYLSQAGNSLVSHTPAFHPPPVSLV